MTGLQNNEAEKFVVTRVMGQMLALQHSQLWRKTIGVIFSYIRICPVPGVNHGSNTCSLFLAGAMMGLREGSFPIYVLLSGPMLKLQKKTLLISFPELK